MTSVITTYSCLSADQKKQINVLMKKIGGVVIPNWKSTCTHLTVEKITLTVKALSAVIDGKPIVNLKYWVDFVRCVTSNLPLPNAKDYKPEFSEMALSKNHPLDYDEKRKTLFKDKVFVFPDASAKSKLDSLITLAGGESVSLDQTPLTPRDIRKTDKQYILLQFDAGTSKAYDDILECGKEMGRRIIPLQEIAMAVVSCSCERDCNPLFDRTGTLLAKKDVPVHTPHVLAAGSETQQSQFLFKGGSTEGPVIPETQHDSIGNTQDLPKQKQATLSSFIRKAPLSIDVDLTIDEDDYEIAQSKENVVHNDTTSCAEKRKTEKTTSNIDTTMFTKKKKTEINSTKRCLAVDVDIPEPKKIKTQVANPFSNMNKSQR